MKRRSNELLLLIFIIMCMCGIHANASRKLLTESDGGGAGGDSSGGGGGGDTSGGGGGDSSGGGGGGGDSSTTPNPMTITFFMHQQHHVMEEANPTATAKPGLGVGGGVGGFPTGLQAGSGIGIPGLVSPVGNNLNGKGNGPLPLTTPSGAINNSPLFGQLPISSTTGLGLGLVPIGGVQGLGLGSGSLVTPGLGLGINVPGIINGQLNPQSALLGRTSGVPDNNVIVIEETLTEGPDLHSSAVLGKGEGYYYHMPNVEDEDEDRNTLLLVFTAKFEGSEYEGSSIEFAGKDNVALPEREIAVVGGTGLFHGAQGHALIQTVSHTDVETVLKFTVTLTY